MREIDFEYTRRDQVLATELLVLGLVRRPEEIKLLPAPKEKRSKLLFDSELERDYLKQISIWMPRERVTEQFKREISTAICEKKISTFSQNYRIEGGDLIDEESGLGLERLNMYCVLEEAEANREVKNILDNSREALVVHFSPENEELGYGDNMIAIWLKDGSGVVRRMGFKVVGDLESLTELYKQYGGDKEIKTNYDLLRNPIDVKNLRLADLLTMMTLEEEKGKINDKQIREVVSRVIDKFYKLRGVAILEDSELILRVYSAAKEEVDRLARETSTVAVVTDKVVEGVLEKMPIHLYNEGKMTRTREKGGACGLEDAGGKFSKEGWILEMKDGKMISSWGSTEGKTFCSRCGCWHEGRKCPYCDGS